MLSCSASKLSLGNSMISFYVCIPSVSTVFVHFDQFLFFLPRSLNFLPHDAELALQKTVLYSPRKYAAAALLGGSFRLTHFQRIDLSWISEEEETNPIFYMIPFLAFKTTNVWKYMSHVKASSDISFDISSKW